MTTVLISKEIREEIEKWSKSYYIEILLKSLNEAGYSARQEVSQNRTHFTRMINKRASQDGIQVSTIGTLTEAILLAEQRKMS